MKIRRASIPLILILTSLVANYLMKVNSIELVSIMFTTLHDCTIALPIGARKHVRQENPCSTFN